MIKFPIPKFEQNRLIMPVKVSFGILTLLLVLNSAIVFAFVWKTDFSSQLLNLVNGPHSDYVNLSVAAISILTIGSWLLVIWQFKNFYRRLKFSEGEKSTAIERLRSSETQVRDLLDNAEFLVFTIDLTGRFTSLNSVGERLTGFSEEEAFERNIADVVAPEHLALVHQMTANKMASDSTTRYEIDVSTKDNTRLTVELSTRLLVEDGKPVGIQGIARDVTVTRRDEQLLRKSEAKYRSLVDSLPAIVYVIEPEPPHRPVYVSPSIASFGFSAEVWKTEPGFWNSKVHPEDSARYIAENESALALRIEKETEYRIIDADGNIRWILDRGKFVTDESGQAISWQGVMLDITESKNADEAIRKSEQIYRFLSEGIVHQIWTAFPNGKLDFVNERTSKYVGVNSKYLVQNGWREFIHPADLERCTASWKHSLRTGEYYEEQFRLLRDDGEYRWHTARATAQLDEGGNIVKWFGTNTDVDEQIRSEMALVESESRYRALLENMSEGLVQVNNDSEIQFVNDRFCQMTGYSSEELVGKQTFDMMTNDEGVEMLKRRDLRRLKGIAESYELCLRKKSGESLWVLVGGAPTYAVDGSINGSMGVFTDITERKHAEEKLVHDAFHDALTGLANRALFTDHLRLRIERARREKNSFFGVLFLDFDRFKVINDSLGHAEGDKLLIAVAQRLESTLRSSDLIARLGGDEFTMLLNELEEPSQATQIASRIQELLSLPFSLESGEVFMSASIGIAIGNDGNVTAEDMLRNADIAMYRAKSKGKARHQVFDQAMHDEALNQLQIETDLRQALGRNEFCLHYQPIFDLNSRSIVGFEALIRWQHPTRGMVPPNEFIPIVEENGLIIPLGRWIMYESCRQMRQWLDNFPAAADLTMSVNLSVKQFLQVDLAEQVMANLVATRLDPKFLKLEITESHVMENGEAAVKMMKRLRTLGAELSLDDFGTGYSSLSYLHRLPVTNLKIDRSFVNQMVAGDENSKLVSTIISLAHNLNINVTAEGIETADQLMQLRALNCEKGQGYFFSKPLDASAATALVEGLPGNIPRELEQHETILELIG